MCRDVFEQTALLQHNETMAFSPKEMQQKIHELLMNNPEIAEVVSTRPSCSIWKWMLIRTIFMCHQEYHDLPVHVPLCLQHYLSYLNNLRVSEYCSAIESLYHYFDRQQATFPNHHLATAKPKTDEEACSRGFRYAALNLASLHYRFGHR